MEPFLVSSSTDANLLFENAFSIVKKTKEHITFIIVLRVAVIKSSQYLKIVLVSLLGFICALIIG
jgi:arginine deiminase